MEILEHPILSASILLLAYLLGSIPTSVWVGKWFYDIDIRDHGSGNAGATNTFRVLGTRAGIPVFVVDVIKGFFAVRLSFLINEIISYPDVLISFQLALGIAAFLGHLFPIFAGFRGGKGVATLLGVVLALHTPAALIVMAVFTLVLLLTRYVSLSSIIAGISFPVLLIFVFNQTAQTLTIFSILIAALLILTHQKNIGRLVRNEESKISLQKKERNRD